MEEKHFYQNIQKVLESLPENFSILEEQIDIDIQVKYFDLARKIRSEINAGESFENRDELYSDLVTEKRKRELLLSLAAIDDVKAFRSIEKFAGDAKGEIKQWAILALQESRMLIQSSLLDEQQVFISTGLGGKGKKIRYYVVFVNKNKNEILSGTQQKLLKEELIFGLNKNDGEFETMDFTEGFSTVLVMLPLQSDIKNVFRNVIDECNQYGDFLDDDMIVTNVKIMSRNEIIDMLKNGRIDEQEEIDYFDEPDEE